MNRKNMLKILVGVMLLINLVMLTTPELFMQGSATTELHSTLPTIYVDPEGTTGMEVGENITVSIKIFNLTDTNYLATEKTWPWGPAYTPGMAYPLGNLYGFDARLSWNITLLEYVDHTVTLPNGTLYPNGVLTEATIFKNEVNQTAGLYSLTAYSTFPAIPFNNPGESNTVFNMTFKVKQRGVSFLHFTYTKLMDSVGEEVPVMIKDGFVGRDVAVTKVDAPTATAQGFNVTVNAAVSNLGGGIENFTASVYYNKTVIDWDNLESVDWEPINPVHEQNATNMPGTSFAYDLDVRGQGYFNDSKETLTFVWDTTGVLDDLGIIEGYFYIKVNATTVPDEDVVDNNENYSEAIYVTATVFRDVLIEDLEIRAIGTGGKLFSPPLVSGETANITFTLYNNGNVPETGLNVTVYYVHPNGTRVDLDVWPDVSQEPDDRMPLSKTWATTGLKGNYTIAAEVSEVLDENVTDNNQMARWLWIVVPPKLNFTYTKKDVVVGDTVSFDATPSIQEVPGGGGITHWTWSVYKGSIAPASLVYTATGLTMNYTFNEDFAGAWPVVLNVTDSFGLFYNGDRLATKPYRHVVNLLMEKAPPSEPGISPILMYVIASVILIVVIVAAVYVFKVRKPK